MDLQKVPIIIRNHFLEMVMVVLVAVFIGFCFAFYELERAKVTVLCRVKLEKDACEKILK